MLKQPECLSVEGTIAANEAFMRVYQRSLLLALEKEGYLHPDEVEACLFKLDQNSTIYYPT